MDSIPLKTFARKIAPYYPFMSYRKALRWVKQNKLPVWPRLGKESINVRLDEIRPFCLYLGLTSTQVEQFISALRD